MSKGISVVIPAYNYGRFLSETLNSALSQTEGDIEVIVVDDGSTDDTRKVVSRFSDRRLRYIYQANQGLSAARNTGILNSRFPYMAFLDADDLWLPGMLEAALKTFTLLPANYGLVACGSVRITADGTPIDRLKEGVAGVQQREVKSQDIVIKSRFMPSAVVVRREVFKEVGNFDTNLRSSEDRDMWIRIAGKYRLHYTSQQLVRIRKHANNMSKNADRMRLNMRGVLAKRFSLGIGSPSELIIFLKSHSYHYFEVAWMYYDEGRIPEAIVSLLASLPLWPFFFQSRKDLNQPVLFRARALARFLAVWLIPTVGEWKWRK